MTILNGLATAPGRVVPPVRLFDLPEPPAGRVGWPWTEDSKVSSNSDSAGATPRISIVTPSYNQGSFIEETVRSVLLQGYPNLEYFVIDGGSSDGTQDVLERYDAWLSGWSSEADNGQSDAIRKGVSRTTGVLINWLNADDLLLPGACWSLALALKDCPPSSVLCGSARIINQEGELISDAPAIASDEKLLPMMPSQMGGVQASHFLTRSAWETVGGVNPALTYTMDTDLHQRCAAAKAHFLGIPTPIAAYREHGETKTSKGWEQSINCKRHYYGWLLWQLSSVERATYAPKVKRHLAGLYLRSISRDDKLSLRLVKLVRAMRADPWMVVEPARVRRAASALIRGR